MLITEFQWTLLKHYICILLVLQRSEGKRIQRIATITLQGTLSQKKDTVIFIVKFGVEHWICIW